MTESPVKLVRTQRFSDDRGWFTETYHAARFAEMGIADAFVQDNQSLSRQPGTIRGIHFQLPPHAQGKLVRCVTGAIMDYAIDLRRGSPTYGHSVGAQLSAGGGEQLWIPAGFGHAFVTLEPDSEVAYKVTAFYARESERGIRWDCPTLAIDWPLPETGPVLSDKDRELPTLAEFDSPFDYDGCRSVRWRLEGGELRIFVTGGAGFIGSALVRQLIAETEHEVLNFDALTYAGVLASLKPIEDNPRYRFVHGDIRDARKVAEAIDAFRPQVIAHLAAESHVDRSIDGPADFVSTNVVGTCTMLEQALAYWRGLDEAGRASFRFHHISTDEVFGSLGPTGRFTETTAYDPRSPYSASKAGSDHLVRAWHETYGLPTLVTNCSNNYGPYHFPEKLIPLVIIRALAGKELPVYGDGSNVRDWLFVEDHCRALRRVFEAGRPGETYNVGGDSERTNIEVVRTICATLDREQPRADGASYAEQIRFVADRPGHDHRYAIDPTKIRDELGWRPQETFEAGIAKTVRWYLDNRDWWQAILDGRYDTGRLGAKA